MTCCATRYVFLFVLMCLVTNQRLFAQSDSSVSKATSVTDISSKAISGLQKQYSNLQTKLHTQSAKLLSRMQAKEDKLRRKLQSKDSSKAQEVFNEDITQRFTELKSKLADTTKIFNRFPLKEYVPGLDSMQTSLSFLLKNPNLPTDKLEQLQSLSTKLKGLQGELQKANDIQAFVREREAGLKEQLLNTGLGKQLTGINKQVYYYQAQLSEYKALLNDKQKLKEKILETVRALPAFQKFWQKNSYLATLFPVPSNTPGSTSLAGLQTRTSVQNLITQRIGTGGGAGVNPQQYFQQQVGSAQAQINQLKDKLSKFSNGGGSSDMTMPDFNPNEQKTKSFLQRLEYGFNIQSEPRQYNLPMSSDLH